MIDNENKIAVFWDDNPVDVTSDANFIWSIANKLRGSFMPDKYGDVIIPMTIIRRFECALENTKNEVIEIYEKNPLYPDKAFYKITGYQFFNTSFDCRMYNVVRTLDIGTHRLHGEEFT